MLCLGFGTSGLGQVVLTVDSTTDPTCADPNGGAVQVSVAGGIDPYVIIVNGITNPTYNESLVGTPGQTVFNLPDVSHAPLVEGTYAISAVDQVFDIDSETITLTITQPILTVPPPPPVPIDICDADPPVDLTTVALPPFAPWHVKVMLEGGLAIGIVKSCADPV